MQRSTGVHSAQGGAGEGHAAAENTSKQKPSGFIAVRADAAGGMGKPRFTLVLTGLTVIGFGQLSGCGWGLLTGCSAGGYVKAPVPRIPSNGSEHSQIASSGAPTSFPVGLLTVGEPCMRMSGATWVALPFIDPDTRRGGCEG